MPRSNPLVILAVATLLLAPTPAQDGASPGHDWRNDARTLEFLNARVASRHAEGDRSVAAASWTLLSYTARGSTMRSGRHRSQVKELTKWLRGIQIDGGKLAPGKQPCQRLDQVVGTLALAEVTLLSHYTLLKPTVSNASRATLDALTDAGAAPPTAAEVALLLVLAYTLDYGKLEHGAACREFALAARARLPAPKSPRDRAAHCLIALLLEEPATKALTVQRTWPKNPMADPLHTWLAVQALSRTDRPTFAACAKDFEKLAAMCTPAGEDRGSWPATMEFDAVTATAALAAALGLAACDPLGK